MKRFNYNAILVYTCLVFTLCLSDLLNTITRNQLIAALTIKHVTSEHPLLYVLHNLHVGP
jgi:hypothetical protein